MKGREGNIILYLAVGAILAVHACGPPSKVRRLSEESLAATLRLSEEVETFTPEVK